MKVLDLPLKAKWYDMIESGVKKEEYRDIKPFWIKRLCESFHTEFDDIVLNGPSDFCNTYKHYDAVRFRYGYTNRTMLFKIESIDTNYGCVAWGASLGAVYFVIKLGERIE